VDETSFEGSTKFLEMKKDAVDSPIVAAAKAKRKVSGESAKMPDSDVVKAFKKSGNEVGDTTADGTKIQELRRRAAKKALKDRLEACVEKGTPVNDCIAESDLKGTFKALLNEKHMKNEVRRAAQDALGKQFTDCVEEKEAAATNGDGRRRLAAHLGACASGLEDYQEKLKNSEDDSMPTLEESKAARRFSFFEDSAKCVYEAAAHSRRLAAHAEAMKKCRMDAVNEMKKTGFDEKEEVAAAFDAARRKASDTFSDCMKAKTEEAGSESRRLASHAQCVEKAKASFEEVSAGWPLAKEDVVDAGSKKKDGEAAALKYAGSITTTATFKERCDDVVTEEQFASDVQKAAGEDVGESVVEKSGDDNSCFVLCKTKGVSAEDSKNVAKAIRESFSATRRRLASHMAGAEVSSTVTYQETFEDDDEDDDEDVDQEDDEGKVSEGVGSKTICSFALVLAASALQMLA